MATNPSAHPSNNPSEDLPVDSLPDEPPTESSDDSLARPKPRLAEYRHRYGLTQKEVCEELLRLGWETEREQLGVNAGMVSTWELGKKHPNATYRKLLSMLYGVSDVELGLRLPLPESADSTATLRQETTTLRQESKEPPTDRRQFMHATLGTLAATSIDSIKLTKASDLGPGTLDELEVAMEDLVSRYVSTPAAELLGEVTLYDQFVGELMGSRHTPTQGQRLYAMAGWLSLLLAELHFDLGNYNIAQSHCRTVLRLTNEVDNAHLVAWARILQTGIATYSGDPQKAIKLASAGRQVALPGSAAAVRLAAMEARAWAHAGDRQGFERAMAEAEQTLSKLTESPSLDGLYPASPPLLPFMAGISYVWLDQPKYAQEHTSQSIKLSDADPDNWPFARVLARIDRGLALAQGNELEGAALVGVQALDLAAKRPTESYRRRAGELRSALAPFKKVSAVRDFNDRYQAIWSVPT